MRIIAWYLPQFHEIPENNEWWGEGFTEWVNVKKATNHHIGQNLPNIPLNNNYYNLLDDDVKKWQIDIAKKHGVYGFAMYHYWFDGKLLLEKPIEQYLANKELDFPFCICWANEHWTNRWVSGQERVLIEQRYGDRKQWEEHFNYLLPFLKDERYITVNGKPLVIIYQPELIECLNDMMDVWQELARENGFMGLTLAYQGRVWDLQPENAKDDSRFEMDIEFQPLKAFNMYFHERNQLATKVYNMIPKWIKHCLAKPIEFAKGKVGQKDEKNGCHYTFDQVWETILNAKPYSSKSIPGAFVGWDNSPRKGANGTYVTDTSPEKFQKYLTRQISRAKNDYNTDIIFMYAWNEWAEGGYLEPDERNKYGYLEAIRGALKETGEWPTPPSAKF